jgi:dihydrofolate synthase / folylpolyglutamate synthase
MDAFCLDHISRVLNRLGNPHHRFNAIHVAGTNGKGSVCAMAESALRSAGFATGMTISPHLITARERIQLNGQPVDHTLYSEAERVVNLADPDQSLSYFERHIAMAFWTFAHHQVDWAVIETGVGGRLDATNVIPQPAVCAITSIGLDHQAWLGDSLAAIAHEKAGIIKPGTSVVLGPNLPTEALKTITDTAKNLSVSCITASPLAPQGFTPDGLAAWQDGQQTLWQIPLLGVYQGDNLATVLAVLHNLLQRGYAVGQPKYWATGLQNTVWPGRFQVLPQWRCVLDGSHNQDGFASLVETLKQWHTPRIPVSLLLTLKANRDPQWLLPLIEALPWEHVWAAPGPSDDYHLPALLTQLHRQIQPIVSIKQVDAELALNGWLVITGSLYTAGAWLLDKQTQAATA